MRVSDCTAGGTGSDAMHIYSSTVSGGTFYGSVTSWGTISGGAAVGITLVGRRKKRIKF